MKKDLLNRYGKDDEGNIVVDVSATRVRDLYNDFDRNAPFIRRDLSADLTDYLIECSRELGRAPFIIQFTLDNLPDDTVSARIKRSIYTYFQYLAEAEIENIKQLFRRSAILFAIGICILFLAVGVNRSLVEDSSVTATVFAEGLTVAAWVSLWEAIAIFLIEWFPHRRNVALFRRLADTKLVFRATAHSS